MPRLTEQFEPTTFRVLKEDEGPQGEWMRVQGRFQLADTRNGNGRIYSSSLWDRVLGESEFQRRLSTRQMRGELEHPVDGVTNISRVSHIVTGLSRNGSEIVGEALILNTPGGQILKELFRAGSPVGISSRGRGTSYMRDGVEFVSEQDFALDTFDFVDKPSTPGAFPQLVESVLTGPYKTEATMDAKAKEILALQVRAHEIQKAVAGAGIRALDGFSSELVESESKINTLVAQQDGLKGDGDKALSALNEARSEVARRRDDHYRGEQAKLDVRVQEAVEGAPAPTLPRKTESSREEPAASASGREQALVGLLGESQASSNYWRERCEELTRQLGEGAVPGSRHAASVNLIEAMVEQCRGRDEALAETTQELEETRTKLTASTEMVEEIISRNDEGRILSRMREAYQDNPELARFEQQHKEAPSLEVLEQMLQLHSQALAEYGYGREAGPPQPPAQPQQQPPGDPNDPYGMAGQEMPPQTEMGCTAPGCGYRETAEAGMGEMECPECGGQMEQMLSPPQPPDDGQGMDPNMDPAQQQQPQVPPPHEGQEPDIRYESELPDADSVDAQNDPLLVEAGTSVGAGGKRFNENTGDSRVDSVRKILNKRPDWK